MGDRITLTSAESALVEQIFAKNDSQGFGVLTGDVAVNVFGGSKLPPMVLGEIWALADNDNKGFLDKQGVGVALRLIGHAQAGRPVSDATLRMRGPLPPASIDGYTAPPSGTRSPAPKPTGLAPLTPQDKAKFARLFQSCGPMNGLLSGDKARDVFVKSKLPVEKLGAIWTLSDTKGRGALDQTDFTIAMYLIQALMSNAISFTPTSLPPGLYEQAASPDAVVAHSTGGSFGSRASLLVPQSTGPLATQSTGVGARPQPPAIPPRAQSAFIPAFPGVPQQQQADTRPWDVTPQEKANADKFFETLDTAKRGYIDGDTAVPFLLQSKLPGDQLAQVWDLADMNNDGRLTRDGFAVAMYLIQSKLAGKDLPATLPATLIPPSMRGGAHAHAPQQLAPVHELSDLLFDDDEPPASKTIVPQSTGPLQPQATGGYNGGVLQPQSTGQFRALQPQSTGARSPPPAAPLTGQSTGGAFGASQLGSNYGTPAPLSQQGTGGFNSNLSPSPFVIPQQQQPKQQDPFGGANAGQERDLFADDEPAPTQQEDKSAEIGNARNQLNSTQRSVDITKSERGDVEARIAEQASQLEALHSQLTAAKASYETESKVLAALRERFSNQTAEIAAVRRELITAESELSGMRVEKAEVEQGVLRDKEEVRDLQRRMAETGKAVEGCKADIEKAKKEAKQQRGLLAIAKKQLAQREAERARALEELAASQADAKDAARERTDAETELATEPEPLPAPAALTNGHTPAPERAESVMFAAAQPLPGTPNSVGSPASTVSRNPFDRLTAQATGGSFAAASPPRTESPFLPFTTASLPGSPPPPAQAQALSTDPFGFEQTPAEAPVPVESAEKPATEASAFLPEATNEMATTTDMPEEAITMPGSLPPDGLVSPSTDAGDLFSTPPSKPADSRMSTFDDHFGTAQLPPLDAPAAAAASEDPASHLPPLDANGSLDAPMAVPEQKTPTLEQEKTPVPAAKEPGTDLGASLMELDANESDSSDGEEDNRPLSTLIPPKAAPAVDAPAPQISFDDAFGAPFNPAGAAPAPTASSGSPFESAMSAPTQDTNAAFDDVFGADTMPKSADAGRSAFDEALGKLPASPSNGAPSNGAPAAAPSSSSFGFDNAFEDSFDFGASSGPAITESAASTTSMGAGAGAGFFPPPPNGNARHSMLPPQNEPAASAGSAFDNAFAPAPASGAAAGAAPSNPFSQPTPAGWAPTAPATTNAVTPPAEAPAMKQSESERLGISFDEAFGGQNPAQALNFDQFGSTSSRSTAATGVSTASYTTATTNTQPSTQHEFPGTTSPRRSGTRESVHMASPPRVGTASPPPRTISPSPSTRPRPSTAGSGRDGEGFAPKSQVESLKAKEPRHSKLSIRLPFGRKKNKGKAGDGDTPPVPGIAAGAGSSLAPLADADEGAVPIVPPTEAVEDDVEGVKQLCGMGFSRTQAVNALETNGYDFQKALNSLLGG